MVTPIIRLRITHLFSFFRANAKTLLLRTLLVLAAIGAAFALAWIPSLLNLPESVYADFNLFLNASIIFVVTLLPFFITKWTFDVRNLQQYPFKPQHVAVTAVFSGMISWPFVWVLVWLGSWFLLNREQIGFGLVPVAAFLLIALTVLITAKLLGGLSKQLFNTARKTKLRNLIAAVMIALFLPLMFNMFASFTVPERSAATSDLVTFVSFTPLGLPFQALLETETNDSFAFALLLFSLTNLAVITAATISLNIRQLRTIEYPEYSSDDRPRLGWFEVLPASPQGAIGARSIIYWLKDPRYRVSLLALPIIPFLVVAVLNFVGVSATFLSFIPLPLILILIAWMLHNDVANDSTAIWLHVSSGITGYQDRLGRLAPIFLFGLPILFAGIGVSIIISGDWQLAAGFFALGFVGLTGSAAVSSVTSVLLPYPATRPEESPFTQPQWQGFGSGFAQTISLTISAFLLTPVIIMLFLESAAPTLQEQAVLIAFSLGYGSVLLLLGVVIGGFIYNKKASDILNLMQVFD